MKELTRYKLSQKDYIKAQRKKWRNEYCYKSDGLKPGGTRLSIFLRFSLCDVNIV